MNRGTYVFKFFIAIDHFFSALLFRDADITISARVGLELRTVSPAWWAQGIGWWLHLINPHHCEGAITWDIRRAEAALEILKGKTK